MSYTHATSINKFGVDGLVVDSNPANGSHTTLAAALAVATAGQTVFLRTSVTEDVTIPPGVNIAGWTGASANVSSIIGTVTMTAAGTSTISGVKLQTNGAAAIAVTGSAASILNIVNCYLNFTNNTGITFSTSNAAATINFINCFGDLGTTGIGIYTSSSAGGISFYSLSMTNSGGSTTASTNSAGTVGFTNLAIFSPLSVSSAANLTIDGGFINTAAQNATCITSSGTSSVAIHLALAVNSGSASALSIGTGTTLTSDGALEVTSSNTNAITGAGTIRYGVITYTGSSSLNNTTTITPFVLQPQPGWILLQTQTASVSASLEFKNINPSFATYAVVISNIKPATDAQDLKMLVSTDNGSTYSVSGYTGGINYQAYNSVVPNNATATTYAIFAKSQSNGVGMYGNAFLTPGNGGWWGQMAFYNTVLATYTLGFNTGTSGLVFNAFKFLFVSGNITSGSISLYGIQA